MAVSRLGRAAIVAAGVVAVAAGATAVIAITAGRGDADAASGPPRFVNEAPEAGVEHRYEGGFEHFVGGGVAVFDCDADGFPDLYFAGGSAPAALYRNAAAPGDALRFTRVESPVTDLRSVTGAYPLDIDSDGALDLAVLRVGPDAVLRGLGDCTFARADEALGIADGDTWTAAFSATWEAGNWLPTLAFGDYLERDRSGCAPSRLVRPAADAARYDEPVALSPGYCTLSALFSDWGRTGSADLRLTNDRHYYRDGSEQLWRVAAGEPPRLYGAADGWRPLQIWGMGIASQDITGDGRPEVFLTSQADNKLQTLTDGARGPAYEDIALARGVTAHRPFAGDDVLPSTAWHAEFGDVNNDGWADLLVTKGNVEAQPEYATRDPNNLLLGRPDGTFAEAAEAAGIVSYRRARGGSLVDLNQDGLLDVVVVNRADNVELWRNVGTGSADAPEPMGNWVDVRLRQPAPNVDAVGAWIDVRVGERTLAREVTAGGGHAGGQLGWVHVGLGAAESAEVRVQWPDGEVGPWERVAAGTRAVLERAAGPG